MNDASTDGSASGASQDPMMEEMTPANDVLPEPSSGDRCGSASRSSVQAQDKVRLNSTTPVTPDANEVGDGRVPEYGLPRNVSEAGRRINACLEYVRETAGKSLSVLVNASGRIVHESNATEVLKAAMGVGVAEYGEDLKKVEEAISWWIVHKYEPSSNCFMFDPAALFAIVLNDAMARRAMQCNNAVQWATEAVEFEANATRTDAAQTRVRCAQMEASVRSLAVRPLAPVVVEVYMQLVMNNVNAYCNECKVEIDHRRDALTDILTQSQIRKLNNRKTARLSAMAERRTMLAFVRLIYFSIGFSVGLMFPNL